MRPARRSPARVPGWRPASPVTFSCTGTFTDAVRAYRMLDQAQLALVTAKIVSVTINDANKHNGYCFAQRIDVLQ